MVQPLYGHYNIGKRYFITQVNLPIPLSDKSRCLVTWRGVSEQDLSACESTQINTFTRVFYVPVVSSALRLQLKQ